MRAGSSGGSVSEGRWCRAVSAVSAIVSSTRGVMLGMELCLSAPFPLLASSCFLLSLPKGTLAGLTTASSSLRRILLKPPSCWRWQPGLQGQGGE